MPSRAASRAAAVRDETPIFDRTAETWWCTSGFGQRLTVLAKFAPVKESAE